MEHIYSTLVPQGSGTTYVEKNLQARRKQIINLLVNARKNSQCLYTYNFRQGKFPAMVEEAHETVLSS